MSGIPSFSRTSSISMSDISTPRSFTSHVSYLIGMVLSAGSGGLGRFAAELPAWLDAGGGGGMAVAAVAGPLCCAPLASFDAAADVDDCGSSLGSGSGGSVATASAEEDDALRFAVSRPNGAVVLPGCCCVGPAFCCAAVGGRSGGVYCVPASAVCATLNCGELAAALRCRVEEGEGDGAAEEDVSARAAGRRRSLTEWCRRGERKSDGETLRET